MNIFEELFALGREVEAHGKEWIIVGTSMPGTFLAVEKGETFPAVVHLIKPEPKPKTPPGPETSGNFTYVADRYHKPEHYKASTLAHAIVMAMDSINHDEDWPVSIHEDDHELWHCLGPTDTHDSLKAFAAQHNVPWKD